MSFLRLIKFEDRNGGKYYGEPQIESAEELTTHLQDQKLYAKPYEGISPFNLGPQRESQLHVTRLLPVLSPADVPIIKCIGLNYTKHSQFLPIVFSTLTY